MAKASRTDTLLGHCLIRAMLLDGGKPTAFRAAKLTPLASRVTTLIVMWGVSMYELDVDELGIEAYIGRHYDSHRTAYRKLADFRRLWPEYENPTPLARIVRDHLRASGESVKPHQLQTLSIAV